MHHRKPSINMINALRKNHLIFRFVAWFFLSNTIAFWMVGSSYLTSILYSTTLFHNFIADYTSWSGKTLIVFFTVVNFLSFMMLLAFIPAICILLLAMVAPYKRLIWTVSVLTASVSLIFLIMDSQVYAMFKFHMNTAILSLIFSNQWRSAFDFSHAEIVTVTGLISIILITESCIAWLIWKKIILAGRFKVGKRIAIIWLSGALFSYATLIFSMGQSNNLFIQQGPNLPLFNQLLAYIIPDKNAQDNLLRYSEQHYAQALFSHDPLNYPRHAMQCTRPKTPYNIILIMVDSLRFDGLNYMPQVMKLSDDSWQFLQHLSGGNSTQAGLFSLFYSIPGNYWTAALEQKKPPIFSELLLKYDYSTHVFWSSGMQSPPMDKTIYLGFKHLAVDGAPDDDVGNADRYTTQQAIQFLTSNKSKQPFFLNLFYDAAHGFCRAQTFPAVYQPVQQECSRIAMTNDTDPQPLYNRYLNAIRFIDTEVGKVINTVQKQGYLNNSIIIFTSDHGQEFNDNHQNYWGHSSNYTSTQVHIPLIIHWPGTAPQKFDYLTSGYDLMPTLLPRLFSCKNQVSDYSIGHDLLQKEGRLPFVLAGSYVNMGIIEADRITALQASGVISITDKQCSTLPDAQPRSDIFNQVLKLMRMYYILGFGQKT